uniref:Sulfurtransferase complex subunit TusB n=1 Tax=Candidatus Aschnera chinzeii TaxID=1485666 RepID=A0AAT9G4Q2_9ENTR|nr:MAG: sulfurtransferase complex subunit TusB [Candidatus Aschnera chinzeii]
MLFSIFTSPYYTDIWSLINLINKKDEIVLLQNGILLAHKSICTNYTNTIYRDNIYLNRIKEKGVNVFALKDDVIARGMTQFISSHVIQITYSEFVKLTAKHQHYFAW